MTLVLIPVVWFGRAMDFHTEERPVFLWRDRAWMIAADAAIERGMETLRAFNGIALEHGADRVRRLWNAGTKVRGMRRT